MQSKMQTDTAESKNDNIGQTKTKSRKKTNVNHKSNFQENPSKVKGEEKHITDQGCGFESILLVGLDPNRYCILIHTPQPCHKHNRVKSTIQGSTGGKEVRWRRDLKRDAQHDFGRGSA